MKKRLILALLGLALAWGAAAQGVHEINLFTGGFMSGLDISDGGAYRSDLYSLYEPQHYSKSSPVLSLDYHYAFNKVFKFGFQVHYGFCTGHTWYRMGGRPSNEFRRDMMGFMPQVKVCIPGSPYFRLYGKVSAGIQFILGEGEDLQPVRAAWEVVPIGAEWGGKRVYGTAEFAFGRVINGGRIGVGFRF